MSGIQFSNEGDPAKMAYLRNPDFAVSPMSSGRDIVPAPGTCLLCVYGQGSEHAAGCVGAVERPAIAAAPRRENVAPAVIIPRPLEVPTKARGSAPSVAECLAMERAINDGRYR